MDGADAPPVQDRGRTRRDFLRYSAAGGVVVGAGALWAVTADRDSAAVPDRGSEVLDFYVSGDGSDTNDGLTPRDAWRSIARINSALSTGAVRHGDTVMFRRGDEFFGNIDSIPRVDGPGPRLTLAAYGQGPRPKISGYKIVENPDSWRPQGREVWKIDLTDMSGHTGNTANTSSNAGFLLADGVIHGAKKWALGDLSLRWDFYNDERFLYVRSEDNPALLAKSLRVAVDGALIVGRSRLLVAGLDLAGSGGHGYRQADAQQTEVVDCRIGPVGGSQLDGTRRYGNGVEIWTGSSDASIHHNEISDVYDAACTMQGFQEGASVGIFRCHMHSNRISNCTQSFEYWVAGSVPGELGGIVDCSFTDNVCVSGGRGWGYATRSDKEGKGNFVMAYRQEAAIRIDVRRNVFFDAINCYNFVNTNEFRFKEGFVSDDNTIALRPGTRIQAQLTYPIEDADGWVARTGLEKDSRWMLVPSSVSSPADALAYVTDNLGSLRGQ